MSSLAQLGTDYKKFLDQTLHYYRPKVQTVRTLFNQITDLDSTDETYEYVKLIQNYAASSGWTSFEDPEVLADGARPPLDGLGTEDTTSTVVSYGKAFRIDRKLLKSKKPIVNDFITKHSTEKVNQMENWINRTLITNMASNAGQSYTASELWSDTGDPVGNILSAMDTFSQQCGGIEADFLLLNNNEHTDLMKDDRMQNKNYLGNRVLEQGKLPENPLGVNILKDPAVTTGTFFLGKKGMMGDMLITENYDTTVETEASAGAIYELVFTFTDQYKLPYYLMYGTGI